MKIKILTINILLCVSKAMAFSASPQTSLPQLTAQLSGVVVDINKSRVPGVSITVENEVLRQVVTTAQDGTYKIDLPVGTYRVKASQPGFCPARRPPFRLVSATNIIVNFTLIPCPIVSELKIRNEEIVGERDRYRDPFSEERFPLVHDSGTPLELVVRYGSRQGDHSLVRYGGTKVLYDEQADNPQGSVRREKYLGATISYDLLTIRADKLQLDQTTFRLEGEGNVVVEDGKQSLRVKRVVVADLRKDEPVVETIPDKP